MSDKTFTFDILLIPDGGGGFIAAVPRLSERLVAWDSIAGHSSGLEVLARIFGKGRKKTVTDPISIAYRNGILHGMDLGYDNLIVAAKVWAALFATREWAIKAERDELEAPPEEAKKTWFESMKETVSLLKKNEEAKERLQPVDTSRPSLGRSRASDGRG